MTTKAHILGGNDLDNVAQYIEDNDVRNILVLLGAGCSVAAGIPDFRSPGTGIYSKLGKYNLEDPADAFSLDLLRQSPSVFFSIANEMNLWPGSYSPTLVHHFVKCLEEEGRLLRCCTQNIDGLETEAGVSKEKLVEAHGSFQKASCIECKEPYDIVKMREESLMGEIPRCELCGGIAKPNVVFFGEQLPEAFFDVLSSDTQVTDFLLVVGTSLQVHPFAQLPFRVRPHVPRVVFNMQRVGGRMFHFPDDPESDSDTEEEVQSSSSSDGFSEHVALHRKPDVFRDLLFRQDCQFSVEMLAQAMGLGDKLAKKVEKS